MSFESSLARLALPMMIVATGTGVIGCGHKAPPTPPPLKNPAPILDLAVQQRGQAAILSFTYPQTTASGELLGDLESMEFWGAKKPVAPPADPDDEAELEAESQESATESAAEEAEPEPSADEEPEAVEVPATGVVEIRLEDETASDPLEFTATAQLLETLDAEAIERAVEGLKVIFSLDLGEASHEQWSHTFAVKTFASAKLPSGYSNLITLVQRLPPSEPTDFQASAEAGGIRLSWSHPESGEEAPEAFRLYRRLAQSRIYSEPLVQLGSESFEFIDVTATFGERYIYAVTAVGHENPLVESFFGGEREIDYADRFAPLPPTNLIALAEVGRVRLLWDASTEDDVVGYIVFRSQPGAEFRRWSDEPVVALEYSDRSVESGTTYEYRVAAVDRVGNQGEQSASVIARVP